ncbi:MAG: hypothetical protein OEZ06_05415 [Myxococcales bacterium]|nr:hypothetical protein [Myxococcales bacterium]
MGRLCTLLAFAASLLLLGACDRLGKFRTSDEEVFRGEVIGSHNDDPDKPSFIRSGFPSHTQMELSFDPALAEDFASEVGTLDTYLCPLGDDGCEVGERIEGAFAATPLRSIEYLEHDALSEYDFPGGGRVRNYILAAHFGQPSPGRVAMVFISLMDTGRIEARVIGPADPAVVGSGDGDAGPLFGVFILDRQRRSAP